jgi:hypothetical protein
MLQRVFACVTASCPVVRGRRWRPLSVSLGLTYVPVTFDHHRCVNSGFVAGILGHLARRSLCISVVSTLLSCTVVRLLECWSNVQSAFYEKVPAAGCRLWCGTGVMCTGGWTKGLLLVEISMTHQGVTLLHTDWKHLAVSAPVLCTVCVVIMFYIESHWIHQNIWKPIVCCLFSGCGINAFRMASSNSSSAEKSCACAYIAFLAGIFSWYADSSCFYRSVEYRLVCW